jgi:hypothetical protein
MEADKLMDMEKLYPEKVDQWMELQNSKSEWPMWSVQWSGS